MHLVPLLWCYYISSSRFLIAFTVRPLDGDKIVENAIFAKSFWLPGDACVNIFLRNQFHPISIVRAYNKSLFRFCVARTLLGVCRGNLTKFREKTVFEKRLSPAIGGEVFGGSQRRNRGAASNTDRGAG